MKHKDDCYTWTRSAIHDVAGVFSLRYHRVTHSEQREEVPNLSRCLVLPIQIVAQRDVGKRVRSVLIVSTAIIGTPSLNVLYKYLYTHLNNETT